ncbi:unnamed protein product [Arabidopsis lyrata]|uniref:Plant thionin family protein n=1 Tax=Arabidopsis lyrata subsp. lyrata TaxID=81972 RepID=D7KK07_ARALL|nr:uncharacterized protein LOC9329223 [Arabidopsis lyrata subsp. lyrata]EFH66699.1 hypothetical protein ARALYDRAFT_472376 [Arabidopsis lyrata subsp. lyrata]CAH8253070.1 unnamed protein product [Arabidopsis lyrata]|eukprot:XP_002890440.1 uncharacterized protein LOC9329223 [Arabidopsis lyrata subsp. lyrata]
MRMKIMSVVWITMLLMALITMGGDAKSDKECQLLCHKHCLPTSIVAECLKCLGICGRTPAVAVGLGTMESGEHK